MSKYKGLKQGNGKVHVVRSTPNTDAHYEEDPYIVETTNPFEAESKEDAQIKAEKELLKV